MKTYRSGLDLGLLSTNIFETKEAEVSCTIRIRPGHIFEMTWKRTQGVLSSPEHRHSEEVLAERPVQLCLTA